MSTIIDVHIKNQLVSVWVYGMWASDVNLINQRARFLGNAPEHDADVVFIPDVADSCEVEALWYNLLQFERASDKNIAIEVEDLLSDWSGGQ